MSFVDGSIGTRVRENSRIFYLPLHSSLENRRANIAIMRSTHGDCQKKLPLRLWHTAQPHQPHTKSVCYMWPSPYPHTTPIEKKIVAYCVVVRKRAYAVLTALYATFSHIQHAQTYRQSRLSGRRAGPRALSPLPSPFIRALLEFSRKQAIMR